MTQEQLAILNSLVTFAAENAPGGLNEREQEVARIVGRSLSTASFLTATYKTHNYKILDVNQPIEDMLNQYSNHGWRLVTIISYGIPGYGKGHSLILERPVGVSHPDD